MTTALAWIPEYEEEKGYKLHLDITNCVCSECANSHDRVETIGFTNHYERNFEESNSHFEGTTCGTTSFSVTSDTDGLLCDGNCATTLDWYEFPNAEY